MSRGRIERAAALDAGKEDVLQQRARAVSEKSDSFPIDSKKARFAEADERTKYPLDADKINLSGPVSAVIARAGQGVEVKGVKEGAEAEGVKDAYADAVNGAMAVKAAWHGAGKLFANNALLAGRDNALYNKAFAKRVVDSVRKEVKPAAKRNAFHPRRPKSSKTRPQ